MLTEALAVPPARVARPLPAWPGGAARPGAAAVQEGPDMGLLARTLLRRLPIILALALFGGAVGYGVQRLLTPRYTSSVELLLEPKRSDSFGADTTFGSMYVDEAKIASVVSVVESADLLARVVQRERLDQVPEFGDAGRSAMRRWLGWLPFLAAAPVDDSDGSRFDRALYRLSRALVVERVGFTYIVTIAARADTPELARRVAGAVADAYLDDQVERKVAATQRDAAWLNGRLDSVRRDLERSEAAVDAVRQRYGLLETALGSGATLDRQAITALNEELIRAQAEEATARARDDQVQHPGGAGLDGLAEVEGSPLIQTLRAKQAEDSKQIASLGASYGANYPAVRRLRQGQDILQNEIDVARDRIAAGRRSEFAAAASRVQALQAQLHRAIASDGSSAGDEGHEKLRDAQRLADENRGLYSALLTKWRELRQQQTREEPEGRIISAADLPDRPSFPKPLLLPLGGAAGFLLFGIGCTALPVLADRRFSSAEAAERRLGLPVLGTVPRLGRRGRGGGVTEFPDQAPLSGFAESLRMTRAVLGVSPDGAATILQVTSPLPGEGKSTVAATLAASAAIAGIPTLLLDADLRHAGASAMFGLGDAPGLAELLLHGGAVASLLHRRPGLNMAVLPAGRSLPPRPELLESDAFAMLLRELARDWRLIVIDSPPALPVSDALVISRHADKTVLVLRWRSTTRAMADRALRLLRAVDAPLAGVLLNGMDVAKTSEYNGAYVRYAETSRRAVQA